MRPVHPSLISAVMSDLEHRSADSVLANGADLVFLR
jgi:hypothetical protein